MSIRGLFLTIVCLAFYSATPAFAQDTLTGKEFTDLTCFDVMDARNGLTPNTPLLGFDDYNENELNRWFYHSKSDDFEPPKGVAIVAHGLNLWPSTMSDVIESLNNEGVDVFRVALTGHRGSLDEMRAVSRGFWMIDMLQSYCWARFHASMNVVPLYYVGFSTGGLVIQDFMKIGMKNMSVNIDRQVLLAPAIALNKWPRRGAKILTYFDLKNLIPSIAGIDHHVANPEGSSAAAFKSILYSMEQTQDNGLTDIPTLVMVDPKDELIDEEQIANLMTEFELENWKLELISKDDYIDSKFNHHYIYNEEAAGPTLWQKIEDRLLEFLKIN